MKRIKLGLILTPTFLVLFVLAACGNKAVESQYQMVKVSRGDIVVSVTADGKLSLPQHRQLTFGTTGTVAQVKVEPGDRVMEGQVLASLDTASLELAVRTAELAIKTAEVDLELATTNFRKVTYPYTYSTFVFDVPASVAAISDAQRQLREAQEILKIGLSFDQYWEAWHRLKQAQDNLAEAKSRLARGQGEDVFASGVIPITDYWTLRTAQLQMEKAQVALDKAKNDLDKANDELRNAVIVASFGGVIAKVDVKVGDALSAVNYATKIAIELIDPSRMELNVDVDEVDIPGVKLGQKAIIKVDALPKVQLEGKVTSICLLPKEEGDLVLYEVKIGFDVPEGSELKAGMSVTADIIVSERSNVLLVPNRAIKQDSQGNPVAQVMVNEQIQERPVVIGISDSHQTEIIAGLNEGEMVVIEVRAKTKSSWFFSQ